MPLSVVGMPKDNFEEILHSAEPVPEACPADAHPLTAHVGVPSHTDKGDGKKLASQVIK
jgi:hypothetical protein